MGHAKAPGGMYWCVPCGRVVVKPPAKKHPLGDDSPGGWLILERAFVKFGPLVSLCGFAFVGSRRSGCGCCNVGLTIRLVAAEHFHLGYNNFCDVTILSVFLILLGRDLAFDID